MNYRSVTGYKYGFTIISIALAYYCASEFRYVFSISTTYASIIFPASGVALASILLFGYRVWPGVWLGNILLNHLMGDLSGNLSEQIISALPVLFIATGASLQAISGAYLVRRFAGFPQAFINGKQIFSFLFYGAVISALVNSTLSISMLFLIGRISLDEALVSWSTWWLGDCLGIFIFTPLVLLYGLKPLNTVNRKQRYMIALPIITLFILTNVAIFFHIQYSQEKIQRLFNDKALTMKVALEHIILNDLEILNSIERFFAGSDQVNKEEFNNFVNHFLANNKSITRITWSPLILHAERETYERRMQQMGYSNFQITELVNNKDIVRVGYHSEYMPIMYVEPMSGNEAMLGYDTYPNKDRHKSIEQAKLSEKAIMTCPPNLLQTSGSPQGIILFKSICHAGFSDATDNEKLNYLKGTVSLTLTFQDLMSQAFDGLDIKGLSYQLIDQTNLNDESELFNNHLAASVPHDWQERLYVLTHKSSLKQSVTFSVSGRMWRFLIMPTDTWMFKNDKNDTLFILLIGLIITTLVVVYAWLVIVREYQLELSSKSREQALERVQNELHQRQQLEILIIKQGQEKARQSQQIAHLDRQRSMGVIAATLGHELNQPLTVIMVNAQGAKLIPNDGLSTAAILDQYMDRIIISAQYISQVTKKVGRFIQPSQLKLEPVDIVKIVYEAAGFLEMDFLTYSIQIHHVIESSSIWVLGDAIQLTQVMLNILRNAVEVLKDQSQRDIFIVVAQQASLTSITLRDNGPGMSDEALQLIGSSFYTTKKEGLGLGLSISRTIIEQHSGEMVITNADTGGACFEIRLPRRLSENRNCSEGKPF